jgi:hypothetical protein
MWVDKGQKVGRRLSFTVRGAIEEEEEEEEIKKKMKKKKLRRI